jgi:hypothetical protein
MIQRHYLFFIICSIAAIVSASESDRQWGGPFVVQQINDEDDWTEISRDVQPQSEPPQENPNKSKNTRKKLDYTSSYTTETFIKQKIKAAYSPTHVGWGNAPTDAIPDNANFILLEAHDSTCSNPQQDASQTEAYFTYFDVNEYLIVYFQRMYTRYPLVLPETPTYHQRAAIARVNAKEKAQEEQVEFYVKKFQKLLDDQLPQKPSFLQQLALMRLGALKK